MVATQARASGTNRQSRSKRDDEVLITRFRVWLQDRHSCPDFSSVELADSPNYDASGWVDLAVFGTGHDLRTLIKTQRDIFAAYLQSKTEVRQDQ